MILKSFTVRIAATAIVGAAVAAHAYMFKLIDTTFLHEAGAYRGPEATASAPPFFPLPGGIPRDWDNLYDYTGGNLYLAVEVLERTDTAPLTGSVALFQFDGENCSWPNASHPGRIGGRFWGCQLGDKTFAFKYDMYNSIPDSVLTCAATRDVLLPPANAVKESQGVSSMAGFASLDWTRVSAYTSLLAFVIKDAAGKPIDPRYRLATGGGTTSPPAAFDPATSPHASSFPMKLHVIAVVVAKGRPFIPPEGWPATAPSSTARSVDRGLPRHVRVAATARVYDCRGRLGLAAHNRGVAMVRNPGTGMVSPVAPPAGRHNGGARD